MKKQILSTIVALNLGLILPSEAALAVNTPTDAPIPPVSSSVEETEPEPDPAPDPDPEPNPDPEPVVTPSTVTGPSMKAVTAEEATSSKNINGHNYPGNWTSIATSYLYENESGGLTRVEATGGKVVIENYNSDFELQGTLEPLEMELPIWGGFYAGEEYNFLVFGQRNPNEDNTVEVIRIVKYTKDWTREGSASVYGSNTTIPLETGMRMVQDGDTLYIHGSHRMYKQSDGVRHNGNISISVNIPDMKIGQLYTGLNYSLGAPYSSHSFNQFIVADGDALFIVNHGDAYPRAVKLTKCIGKVGTALNMKNGYSRNVLPIKGGIGNNYTGASVGGLVISDSSCIIAGSSIPQDPAVSSKVRNIFVTSTPKDNFGVDENKKPKEDETKIYWITNYTAGSKADVSNPHLIKIDDDNILLLCTVNGRILYTTLDGEGVPKGVLRENGTTCTIDELLNESTKEDETPGSSDNENETPSDSDNENETPGDSDSENDSPSDSDKEDETPSDPDSEDESKDNGIYTLNKTEAGDWYLSDCVPIVYNDKVVWYYTNNSKPVFCSIDLNYPGDIIDSEEFNKPGIPTNNPGINPNPGNSTDPGNQENPGEIDTPIIENPSSSDDDDDDDDSSSSSSSSTPSSSSSTIANSSFTGKETLSSSEQKAVAEAVTSVLGSNTTVTSVEKTDNGVCITSTSGDVIYSKTDGSLAINEWEKVGETWYYFDADKKAAKGWKNLGDKWYYLDDTTSKMVTGWKQTATGNWFYFDTQNGDMKSDWQLINNKWYYLDTINGDMKSDWQLVNGKWYYLDLENGDMKTGWIKWNNNWYYLDAVNGDCLMNTVTPDGYTLDENGAWIQ